jgi:hypothetical protein
MRTLSGADYLDLWERGCHLHPLDQGLLALSAALSDSPRENVADWPLGRRNQALAELRCLCFGPRLQGWISCPQCEEKLEFQMDARTMVAQDKGERRPSDSVEVNGHRFRLPTTRDLALAAKEEDPHAGVARLLNGCCLDTQEPASWSDEEIERIGDCLASADPLSELRVSLECAECGTRWDETLDLVAFLWKEVEARAKRLLLEIHTLASAYGWSESEILSLSDHRRAAYLEMVRA